MKAEMSDESLVAMLTKDVCRGEYRCENFVPSADCSCANITELARRLTALREEHAKLTRALKKAERERDESDYALIMSNSDECKWNSRCRNALGAAAARARAAKEGQAVTVEKKGEER